MFVLVITGGLGAGKSSAAEYCRARGAVVLDLDEVAARLLAAGSPLVQRVAEEFGQDLVLADGSLDRDALAARAFSDARTAARLNAIVHPAVAREVGPALHDIRLMQEPPAVVVMEVPLLAEAPVFAEMADRVLAITAPEHVRLARVVARGMDPDDAARRIRAQASDEARASMADDVIVNDGDEQQFFDALSRYCGRYLESGGAR